MRLRKEFNALKKEHDTLIKKCNQAARMLIEYKGRLDKVGNRIEDLSKNYRENFKLATIVQEEMLSTMAILQRRMKQYVKKEIKKSVLLPDTNNIRK